MEWNLSKSLLIMPLLVFATGLRAQTIPTEPAPPTQPPVTAGSVPALAVRADMFPVTVDPAKIAGVPPATLTQPLTLGQALSRALEANAAIGRARTQIEIAEQQKKQLLSSILPHLLASGATTRNTEEVSFGTGDQSTTVLPLVDWNYRIVLTQPVYAGNRERRAYDQAKINIQSTEQAALGTQDQVLLRVASNYLAAVEAGSLLEVEKTNVSLAEKQRQQAQAFYTAGEVTKVDVLRAETQIKAAQRALTLAEQVRDTAIGRLRVDLNLDGPVVVVTSSSATPPVPAEVALIQSAEQTRPEVAQAEAGVRIAQLEVRKQRGNYLPTVSAEAGFVNQKAAFPASKYGYAKLNFSVPIFESGEFAARVAAARQQELQAQLLLDETRLNVREDVRKALLDLRAAETSLSLAKEQLAAAEAEYSQSFELYRAQEATSLDLATSEAGLADARRAVVQSTLDSQLAALRVFYAAGTLKPALMENSR
jgi:outer membrane protein